MFIPVTFRFILIILIISGLIYGAMVYLSEHVQPQTQDVTFEVPPHHFGSDKTNPE
jgi:hypothetical protein